MFFAQNLSFSLRKRDFEQALNIFFGFTAMPTKSRNTIGVEDRNKKIKSRTPLRDLKPASKSTKGSFTVRQLHQDDMPTVEPLIENSTDQGEMVNQVDRPEDYENFQNQLSDQDSSADQDEVQVDEEADYDVEMGRNMEDVIPKDTVRVRFSKFVQLVANRDFSEVVNANPDEEIIMSSNLLTELAGASDQRGEKKVPLVFLVGIAIGVVLTYILFSN